MNKGQQEQEISNSFLILRSAFLLRTNMISFILALKSMFFNIVVLPWQYITMFVFDENDNKWDRNGYTQHKTTLTQDPVKFGVCAISPQPIKYHQALPHFVSVKEELLSLNISLIR